jgi:DNA-binding NtrC family response regulator
MRSCRTILRKCRFDIPASAAALETSRKTFFVVAVIALCCSLSKIELSIVRSASPFLTRRCTVLTIENYEVGVRSRGSAGLSGSDCGNPRIERLSARSVLSTRYRVRTCVVLAAVESCMPRGKSVYPSHVMKTVSPRVLIADDQADVLEALRLLLKGEGFQIESATSPAGVMDALETREFEAILMDLNYTRDTTSGEEGLQLVTRIHAMDATLPVIVMTAWGSIELAVEAMRRGARDFIQKPWENPRLLSILRTQVELGRSLRKEQRLEAENRLLRAEGRPTMIAESPAMQPVLQLISRVAPSDANVLITGEHGTGKEVVARTLHALSNRASKPMVTVNVGGLAEGVFESEMFGHVRGAFTDAKADRVGRFDLADGGTLFLDEIANVPLNQQAKLLRVLETGELERVGSSKTHRVDVRILSATNANLNEEVAAGRFRGDLLFRLNTIEIHLPPLRDRREDIHALAAHFLELHAKRYRKHLTGFDSAALQGLRDHPWPGNVRELDHTVERSVLMAQKSTVGAADLGLASAANAPLQSGRLEDMSMEEVESFLIRKALTRYGNNVSQAANALGLSRSALYRRMQRYGI